MALAARMVSVIYPLNNVPFFELQMNNALVPEGADLTQQMQVLARFDRRVMDQLAGTNYRSALFTAYQHLIVVGDCLLFEKNDYSFQVFRLDQYVVRRSPDGQWRELIVQEWVDPEYLPAELEGIPSSTANTGVGPNGQYEAVYTQVLWNKTENRWDVKREFRGQSVGEDSWYEVTPYFPLRWTAVAGEDYGRALVEDAFGDIRTLDALSKALIEGSILNAEYRWGVNPSGITEIRDWDESVNGDSIPAVEGDIFPIQAQNNAQVSATLQAVVVRENKLGRRFLMNSVVQPQGERVTARQVSIIAQELEQTLGGVLSMSSRDVQIPTVRRTIYQMSRDKLLPPEIKDYIKDQNGILKLSVKAGLEALNREVENEKLMIVAEQIKNLPPEAQQVFIWPAWIEKWLTSFGLETVGLVKTQEQVMAEQQAAMQQQQAFSQQETAQEAALIAAEQQPQEQV